MSGIVHNITTRRTFTFTNVATSVSVEIPLLRAMDISDAKSIELMVRVHSVSIGAGASLTVKAYAVSLTSEEPDTDFLSPSATSPTALATVTLNSSTTAPSLQLAALSTPYGHMMRVTVTGNQAGSTQTISAALSIDVLVRDT